MKTISKEKFNDILGLSCDLFRKRTHMKINGMCDYSYDVDESEDTIESRLSYLDYLINEKHFNESNFLPQEDYITIRFYYTPGTTSEEIAEAFTDYIKDLSYEDFEQLLKTKKLDFHYS